MRGSGELCRRFALLDVPRWRFASERLIFANAAGSSRQITKNRGALSMARRLRVNVRSTACFRWKCGARERPVSICNARICSGIRSGSLTWRADGEIPLKESFELLLTETLSDEQAGEIVDGFEVMIAAMKTLATDGRRSALAECRGNAQRFARGGPPVNIRGDTDGRRISLHIRTDRIRTDHIRTHTAAPQWRAPIWSRKSSGRYGTSADACLAWYLSTQSRKSMLQCARRQEDDNTIGGCVAAPMRECISMESGVP